jgi:hypothetical protein
MSKTPADFKVRQYLLIAFYILLAAIVVLAAAKNLTP